MQSTVISSSAGPSATLTAAATRRVDDDVAGGNGARAGSVRAGARSPAASDAGVRYRSSIYRSASPRRRVGKDMVVHSNLARAPRFKDIKTDVPGAWTVCVV